MPWKSVKDLSDFEVVLEAERLALYAEDCRELEQGLNSKETVRFRACMARIESGKLMDPREIVSLHTRWDPNLSRYYTMLLGLFQAGESFEARRPYAASTGRPRAELR